MIRVWLSTARAARVRARAERGERAWRRDLHEHPDERDAFRLAQIAGLRDTNAELRLALALTRRELATYKTRDWLLPCEYGLPDHCKPGGRHALCAHHGRTPGYPRPSADTYLTLSSGRRFPVWRAVGPACIWRCACEVCAAPAPPADEQLSLFDLAGAA